MGYATSYDGIVIGAGHNGLILQAYLCRAGMRVLSIDRAPVAGGGLYTTEDPAVPGMLHNTHAVFLRGLASTRWFRDLELDSWGLRTAQPELNLAVRSHNGPPIDWYVDPDRTAAAIAEFSVADAAAWTATVERYQDVVDLVLNVENYTAPLPAHERARVLAKVPVGARYRELDELSPLEFINRTFVHPAVRALLLFLCVCREVDVHVRHQGAVVPALIAGRGKAQLAVGGSNRVAQALVNDITAHGGHVMTGVTPRRILVEDGRARGVELADRDRVTATRFVASSLNPRQTFLDLCDPDVLPAAVREAARSYRYQVVGPLFGLYLGLADRLRYAGDEQANPLITILGLEDPADVLSLYEDGNRLARNPIIWGGHPTVHDPSQAPPGAETAFMWQKVPYAVDGDPRRWDEIRTGHGGAVLDQWRTYAKNLTEDIILSTFVHTPLDTERHLPNMTGGDLGVGWLGPGQLGAERPMAGAPAYRTVLPGLYLCGSSTHPGGNITGLPGYNAAGVIAHDTGVQAWWDPPSLEEALSALL